MLFTSLTSAVSDNPIGSVDYQSKTLHPSDISQGLQTSAKVLLTGIILRRTENLKSSPVLNACDLIYCPPRVSITPTKCNNWTALVHLSVHSTCFSPVIILTALYIQSVFYK